MWRSDNRGDAYIWVVMALPIFIIFFGIAGDIGRAVAARSALFNAVNHSTRAAVKNLDLDELSRRNLRILEVQATQDFYKYLKENLHLDDSLNPMPGSFADGQVVVDEFNIINTLPFNDPVSGNPFPNVGIHTVVRMPLKYTLLGPYVGNFVTIRVHVDTVVELQ